MKFGGKFIIQQDNKTDSNYICKCNKTVNW